VLIAESVNKEVIFYIADARLDRGDALYRLEPEGQLPNPLVMKSSWMEKLYPT
jgi:hypothetical protein